MISLKVLVLKDLSCSSKTTFKQSKQNIPVIGFENEYFNLEDVSDIGYSDKLILFDIEKI